MTKKRDISEFEEFDHLEAFDTEKHVRGFFKTIVKHCDPTPEEVEHFWESVKLASERYGYNPYAVEDAYLEALAAVRGETVTA